nr:protein NRDE2 homolog isoform X2 [Quercus suber]
MGEEKGLAESEEPKPSLFPLFPASDASQSQSQQLVTPTPPCQWLSNSSFTADLSVINDAVSIQPQLEEEEEEEEEPEEKQPKSKEYEFLESDQDDNKKNSKNKKKKKKKKKKRKRSKERADGARKSGVRAWAGSDSNSNSNTKDYYFESRGDPDNLAFGSLYRMDIARYKPHNPLKLSGLSYQGLYWWNRTGAMLDRDGDLDALDSKLVSAGRYWSAKYTALERHKSLKRVRLLAPIKTTADDFIPLSDIHTSHEGVDSGSVSRASIIEESWEDEVLRRTRDFNKLTRENPHDEKVWLAFAEFQDRVAGMQPQKGARLQTLEKKISILEKAAELNPENEDLLLCLLKAYQNRDNIDVLISRWEKILMQHPGSYKLWREFLHVVQGDFSRFKVSDMRKMYAHAIQALSAASSKHFRQVHQSAKPSDTAIVQLELGLVDIFLSLCRFEWQAGYQELATALFQAEIEFSLFCPLLLTEQSRRRLFEHFWNSDGARVGEEDALGWSTWLEREEENRQKVIKDEESTRDNEKGGWTGWSEPLFKDQDGSRNSINAANNNLDVGELQEEFEDEDVKEEDETEALLKKLGIDVEAEASCEVKETSTWARWSEEESSRDCDQWMPLRRKSAGGPHGDGTPDREGDEQLLRVILYEDVNEYLFSLSSVEARLSLMSQFIDFFGGKISQCICTNNSSWIEKVLSLEALPDAILSTLRRVHDALTKAQSSLSSFSLEELLGSTNDISKRTDMMKFLRNATLLCLTAFPRNYILEEAALVAEELSATKMNSSRSSDTPCRVLAKRLLKSDRQDVLLCGVYARREAAYGNIDHARRVFDMALSLIEGLPMELRSNAPLLYFWYAEAELANNPADSGETSFRALHILSCLGSGETYSPFKSQPSSLKLLRAHQGFKERIRTVRSAWVRGLIDDQSVALICSAALFEELTSGWAAGIEVLDQAFATVLPERQSHSYQLEYLFNYYVKMLQRHHKQLSLSKVWESVIRGLQIYPFSPELFGALLEIGHLYTTPNKLRWMFDDFCHKKPSVIVWIFALLFEMSRGSSQHRIHGLFERALANEILHNSVVLWRCYVAYEINIACNPSAARRIFFRAIHACPWSKSLWLDGFLKLNSILTGKELSDLQEVMRDKELNLRTDIYEILLQDDLIP